ncbi:MAG: PLP-dependent aminotransferase family protein [Lentisphaerota bacterium]
MLNAAGSRNVISFAAGLPDPKLFPVEAIAEAAAWVLKSSGSAALQYSSSEGFLPLRRHVAENILSKRGISTTAEHVLITSGSQQGLDLVAKVFIDQGDPVFMESPAYLSAIQAFELCQPQFVGIPIGPEGLDLDALDQNRLTYPQAKLLYVVPNFQNPTGLCYSEWVRKSLAARLEGGRLFLVEDDPYRELRFEGEDLPPINTYMEHKGVLMGTFSKVLSPGLRMGWIHAAPSIIRHLVVAKQATDLCSSDLTQRILFELLTQFNLDDHIDMLRQEYRKKRDLMLHWIQILFPAGTGVTRPQGGMFIWMTLPGRVSADKLLAETLRHGVMFAPGRSFYPGPAEEHTLRLNFTHAEDDAMEKGLRIMAEALQRLL